MLESYAAFLDRLRHSGVTLKPVEIAGWDPGKARRAGLLLSEAEGGALIGADLDRAGDVASGDALLHLRDELVFVDGRFVEIHRTLDRESDRENQTNEDEPHRPSACFKVICQLGHFFLPPANFTSTVLSGPRVSTVRSPPPSFDENSLFPPEQ
jgi:hypothetical protein